MHPSRAMSNSLRIGRVFGLQVNVAFGWIAACALASLSLMSLAPRALPYASSLEIGLFGLAAALIGAASFAMHELAHGVVLRTLGVPVRRVMLFLVGSVTDVERAPSPKTEALVSVVALSLNAAIAIAFHTIVRLVYGSFPSSYVEVAGLGYGGALLAWTALVNAVVVAVELVPALPLDGGHLLRAAARRLTGSFERSTRCAAISAQIIGWSFMVAGLFLAVVTGALAMWIALFGWFLASSAARAYELTGVNTAAEG